MNSLIEEVEISFKSVSDQLTRIKEIERIITTLTINDNSAIISACKDFHKWYEICDGIYRQIKFSLNSGFGNPQCLIYNFNTAFGLAKQNFDIINGLSTDNIWTHLPKENHDSCLKSITNFKNMANRTFGILLKLPNISTISINVGKASFLLDELMTGDITNQNCCESLKAVKEKAMEIYHLYENARTISIDSSAMIVKGLVRPPHKLPEVMKISRKYAKKISEEIKKNI